MIIREDRRALPTRSREHLHISTDGSIRVRPAATAGGAALTLRHEIAADDEGAADELLRLLALEITPDHPTLAIAARYQGRRRRQAKVWPPVRTEVTVTLPAPFSARLESGGHRIDVGNVAGDVLVASGGGVVTLGRIGGSVAVRSGGGEVRLAAAIGPVDLRTAGGRVQAGTLAGPASFQTSGGAVQIARVAAALHAATDGGAFQAGIGWLGHPSRIVTRDGAVWLSLSPDLACDLDVHARSVTVGLTGAKTAATREPDGKVRLRGRLNGGGPALVIEADDVRLEPGRQDDYTQ